MIHTEFGTVDDYRRVFAALLKEGIPDKQLQLIRAHAAAADHTVTWGQLAATVGYPHGKVVNLQYGKLARRVAERLGVRAPPKGFWLYVLVGWAQHRDSTNGHTAFVLRQPVIEALTALGTIPTRMTSVRQNHVPTTAGVEEMIGAWAALQRWMKTDTSILVPRFFRQAFDLTRHSDAAWFGIHSRTASLVSGGIFLAAIHNGDEDRGVWLLTDGVDVDLPGITITPVRSTLRGDRPLTWLHLWPLDSLFDLLQSAPVWESFANATHRVLEFPIGRGREGLLQRRGKLRLSELWKPEFRAADEIAPERPLNEGSVRQVIVNAYERSAEARRRYIAYHGTRCSACDLDLSSKYGPIATGYVHVHHLRQLSEIGEICHVDPIADLRPVCPNCHAVIHRRTPPFTIEDVRGMIARCRLTGVMPNSRR